MIARIVHYHALRRNHIPHRLAWAMSGLGWMTRSLKDWLFMAMIAGFCLYLMSSAANAFQESADNRSAAKISNQTAEIVELRKIVAACLGEKEGALVIGGEHFLCKATSIGERIR